MCYMVGMKATLGIEPIARVLQTHVSAVEISYVASQAGPQKCGPASLPSTYGLDFRLVVVPELG